MSSSRSPHLTSNAALAESDVAAQSVASDHSAYERVNEKYDESDEIDDDDVDFEPESDEPGEYDEDDEVLEEEAVRELLLGS